METRDIPWLTRESLRRAAGEQAFARGEEYLALGQVLSLAAWRDAVAAVVEGARPYRVLLRGGGDTGLAARCDCPAADRAGCCKHCVAAGLAYLREPERLDRVRLVDAADCLRARSHDQLVELLLAEALVSESLRERLLLEAANHTGKSIEIESYLRAAELALSKAVWSDGDEAGLRYLSRLKTSLGHLADAGREDDLRTIVDHALHLLAASQRPSPASLERLREFSAWLRRLRAHR